MNMKNKKVLIVLGIFLAGILFFSFSGEKVEDGKYDNFAKCLTESEAKIYGAYWCGNCKSQKKTFGNSWKYVNYIECDEGNSQTAECKNAGITAYPTWEFAEGSRLTGNLLLQQLSSITDCPLE